jgi:hypothetical protein
MTLRECAACCGLGALDDAQGAVMTCPICGGLGRSETRTLAIVTVPRLPAWAFQPDADAPGLYLQCQTVEQRAAIMRALGAPEELCR